MKITFLGTVAARPTPERNVSSLVIRREGELLMFDCGEGTQRQMMRYGTGFDLNDIFFSHLHADHFLGVIGLLQTMGLQGRTTPMNLWSPSGTEGLLRDAVQLGGSGIPFSVRITGLEPGEEIERPEYRIAAFRTRHRARSLGYALREHPRLGRFDPNRARELGVPEGPLWGRLHRGEEIQWNGEAVAPADLVGPPRGGRAVVYTGDTAPSEITTGAAAGADLLIHEATFASDETARAVSTGHSTARQAAEIARDAGVRQLVLTHLSSRYAAFPERLATEAKAVFPDVQIAHDGLRLEIPFVDE